MGGFRTRLTPVDYMLSRGADAVWLFEFSSHSQKPLRGEKLIFHVPSVRIHLTLIERAFYWHACIALDKSCMVYGAYFPIVSYHRKIVLVSLLLEIDSEISHVTIKYFHR